MSTDEKKAAKSNLTLLRKKHGMASKAESVISKNSASSVKGPGNKTLRSKTPMRKIVFKDDMQMKLN